MDATGAFPWQNKYVYIFLPWNLLCSWIPMLSVGAVILLVHQQQAFLAT
jgi:hypothetical protein